MVRIYLAGPMTNQPYFNYEKFMDMEGYLSHVRGYEVFNPIRHDIKKYGMEAIQACPNGTKEEAEAVGISYKTCLRDDLCWIIDNADAIALLPGWEQSKGCRAEKALAECLGLEEVYL